MQISTGYRLGRKNKPGRVDGMNLWRQWLHNPDAIRWLLRDDDVLHPDDVAAVKSWAQAQLEWGLHVRLHEDVAGQPQVIEVFGPDLIEPHVLFYRVGKEIQVDEHHGASRRFPAIAAALDFVVGYT